MSNDGKTVLITGASQGMGLEAAKIFSSKGANVIIVARNKQRLEEALQQISRAASDPRTQRFHSVSLDVTSPEANDALLVEATTWNNNTPPDIIWANAGMAIPSLFLDATPEAMRTQMDVNYWSAAFLAQSALRSWLASPDPQHSKEDGKKGDKDRSRHFIMTSSTASFVPVAGYAPYSPTKAALRSLHDQLKSELNLYNGAFSKESKPPPSMHIHTVFPGTILTPGFEEENKTKHEVTRMLEEGDPAQTANEAARKAIQGLQAGKHMVTTQGLMGEVMKASSWQGSRRDNWFLDTVLGWIMGPVWVFVSWGMERKVWKMGFNKGVPMNESSRVKEEV